MKAYQYSPHPDYEHVIGVVADNVKEAKKLGSVFWGSEHGFDSHDWFIEQRAKLIKDIDINGLPKGVVPYSLDGLRRGFYAWLEYEDCPRCGEHDTRVSYDLDYFEGGFYCYECEEKEDER